MIFRVELTRSQMLRLRSAVELRAEACEENQESMEDVREALRWRQILAQLYQAKGSDDG